MTLFSDAVPGIQDRFLGRAYELAEAGRGTTSPNPLVGCVVARDGEIVGEGFHTHAGGPHAEVVALNQAGAAARGAHVFVTLEPCSHFGRTPPCVDRLLAEGVAAVTIGMRDPDKSVSGGGAEILSNAGVKVRWADDASPFEAQNEAWLTRMRLGRPFVRVKVALTLDGRPALAARRRSAITGEGGRRITMMLRSQATAVCVGAATVAVDDPELTVRDRDGNVAERSPRRVVLARTSVPEPRLKMIADGRGCTIVVSDAAHDSAVKACESAGARVLRYAYAEGLDGALRSLAGDGVNDVLMESGPSLFSALWSRRLIDELVVVTAGGMGGNAAPPLFLGTADAEGSGLAPVLSAIEAGLVEGDAFTVWRPRV